ncbi:hypothetical protein BDV24DRAFT_140123 [Aspergillus arachidicola]|uniref:Uncharacterized protein n=1 Tax=Aspergillus arachidicola TaxID=656916 RepID=A0A5N6XW18_9EURO|nr:hypothetical protein BDV24DRAFT_140123 [Aspergillus arachidicola]
MESMSLCWKASVGWYYMRLEETLLQYVICLLEAATTMCISCILEYFALVIPK